LMCVLNDPLLSHIVIYFAPNYSSLPSNFIKNQIIKESAEENPLPENDPILQLCN
jgi:hypothetical protein